MHIDDLLREMSERKGSDLHVKVDRPPLIRIAGDITPTEHPPVTREQVYGFVEQLSDAKAVEKYRESRDADFAYTLKGIARFRVNALHQMDEPGLVIRLIPLQTPTIDGLGLPPVLKDVVQRPNGLVLVTGPTGSGKSTSLAAMIQHTNETRPVHIITIEDPIEFVYRDRMAEINQREVGRDVKSFGEALRRALRQDPDVILMGELRDQDTIETAIHAAETGHLVFGTLHTNDAKQTVDRIIDTFPGNQHEQIRSMLSITLEAVLSQRLVRRADGGGRVGAMEVLIGSPQVRELIKEGKTMQIDKAMTKAGSYYRMQTFNQSLAHLAMENIITHEEALSATSNPGDLQLLLKGIMTSGTSSGTGAVGDTAKLEAEAAEAAEAAKPEAEKESGKAKISKGFKFG